MNSRHKTLLFTLLAATISATISHAVEDSPALPARITLGERNLFLETDLAKTGEPAAVLVVPEGDAELQAQARKIADALAAKGITIPIASDADYRDLSGLEKNLILLGTRDTNLAIKKLYYLHYTLLDTRYPGPGGSVVRSLHNPFGDGHNIILVGGGDKAGLDRAVEDLIAEIEKAPSEGGNVQLGFLQKIHLGKGITPPELAKDAKLWESSTGYGNGGYFGWNQISRNLALFYMTGEERYAKEFLRLAFPDAQAVEELVKLDKEAYDDPHDPLVKPYHYQAAMMILYWDLVEAHPFFTPEDRQRVREKFLQQLHYHAGGMYSILDQKTPATALGDRHKLWEAVSIQVLARYFQKYYPSEESAAALKAVDNIFAPFNKTVGIGAGSLWWYNTFIEPAFVYAALSNPLQYENNPVVREYADAMVQLSDRTEKNWAVRFSSPFLLNLAAALSGDQALVDLIAETGQETDSFRVGQSYWPVRPYPKNYLEESTGKIIARRFDPKEKKGDPRFNPDDVVDIVSWRQKPDATGDFLLLDTKYEAGRNPFHNFALIGLRINGDTLLSGYANQILIYRDGQDSSSTSLYTKITGKTKIGDTVIIQGFVKNLNGFEWRRTFLLRENRFLLVADELTATEDESLTEIHNDWQEHYLVKAKKLANEEFLLTVGGKGQPEKHYHLGCSQPAEVELIQTTQSLGSSADACRFNLFRQIPKEKSLFFATLLSPGEARSAPPTIAQKDDVVALRLPDPALLTREGAGLLLTEQNQILGFQVKAIPGVLTADKPVNVNLHRETGNLLVQNEGTQEATVRLVAGGATHKCPPGQTIPLTLPPAKAAGPDEAFEERVTSIFKAARVDRAESRAALAPAEAPALTEAWQRKLPEAISVIQEFSHAGNPYFAIASGRKVVIVDADGKDVRAIEASDTIGALYWWDSQQLLLVGSRDEKLRAFDFEGKERWTHTAEMAPELVASQKFYWFKASVPGVIGLKSMKFPDGQDVLFVGGASTVEILNPQGALQKRFYQEYGAVDGFSPAPAEGKLPARMLCRRSMGGWPTVFEVFPDGKNWKQRDMGHAMVKDMAGTDMGQFGYSMVGRNFLSAENLTPGGPQQLVGDFNGVLNRLMLWNPDGTPVREINLGPGTPAQGVHGTKIYGHPTRRTLNVRGVAVTDLDGDQNKDILVATESRYVLAFDHTFKKRFLVRLHSEPLVMMVVERADKPPLIAVAQASGEVLLIDATGKILGSAKADSALTTLAASDGLLVAGAESGAVMALKLP